MIFTQTKTSKSNSPANVMKYVRSNNLSKILSDIRRGLKKETIALTKFEREQLRLQKWTLVAIVLTLSCYVWLAFLQKNANALTQRSLSDSHAPWVGIQEFSATYDGAGKISYKFEMENFSDSPAINISSKTTNESTDPTIIFNSLSDIKSPTEITLLMPHQKVQCTGFTVINPATQGEFAYKAVIDGRLSFVTVTKYQDVIGRTFQTTCSVIHDTELQAYLFKKMEIVPPPDY